MSDNDTEQRETEQAYWCLKIEDGRLKLCSRFGVENEDCEHVTGSVDGMQFIVTGVGYGGPANSLRVGNV